MTHFKQHLDKKQNLDKKIQTLEKTLGVSFVDINLLAEALRHASASTPQKPSYERLEFLGDRVLGLAVAHFLFKTFPKEPEGLLARRLSHLVSEPVLAEIGNEIGLDTVIESEQPGNLAQKHPSIIADSLEALLGLIYLERGFSQAQTCIERLYGARLTQHENAPKDPKSALQEYGQKHLKALPTYELLKQSGPDHDPCFQVRVRLGTHQTQANGRSLKIAEKKAAKELLKQIKEETKKPQPTPTT